MITLADIREAQTRLQGVIYPTPLLPYSHAPREAQVWFKPEQLQPIGSFKLRGAYNRIAAIPPTERGTGVIAYSSGNHAQGVAYAARLVGLPAVIVMPTNAPAIKIEATRKLGAEVVLYDAATQRREEIAARLMQGQAWTLVPPFNDPFVMAGQGTIGLEVFQDMPDVDLIITPIGGGGLIGGIATAIKLLKPSVKVIGVEPELADDARRSFREGKIVALSAAETNRTIADGVRTLALGELTFAHVTRYVDDILTVSEAEIREATRRLLLEAKQVVEPTGALPFAAYLFHHAALPPARKTVLVISGGNIDPAQLSALMQDASPAAAEASTQTSTQT
jgi:threonine dehydratase